jgi:hypothetical protein
MRSIRRAGFPLLAACALLAACGSAPPRPPAAPVEDAPSEVATEVKGVVQEAYGSLGHGNREGILPLLADQVYAIGPGPHDLVQARSDVVVALTAMFPAEKKHRMASHALRAVVSPGGKSAYVTDQIDIDGTPYAATLVMELQGDVWVAVAIHVARPIAAAKQATEALPPIAERVDPGARGAVELFTQGVDKLERFIDQLADGPDVVAIGAGPRELVRGGAAIHKAWKKALKKKPSLEIIGGVRAGVTPDGQLAWIHANVDRADGKDAAIPHRAFFVYAHDGASWRLAVAHEAAAVK